MKITVEPDKCVASGQCVVAAEQVFDQDDDGIVRRRRAFNASTTAYLLPLSGKRKVGCVNRSAAAAGSPSGRSGRRR